MKGQLQVVGLMMCVMIFLTVIVLIEPLKIGINLARDPTHLDCLNTSIGVGQSMTCIIVDWSMPLFIGFGLAVAVAFIGIRSLMGGGGGSLQ